MAKPIQYRKVKKLKNKIKIKNKGSINKEFISSPGYLWLLKVRDL